MLIQDPDEVLERLDGLIVAGGSDVDPATYGAEPHAATTGVVRERDRFELALTARALELDLPYLGICRGMQVLNVARGGTLLQHLPDSHGHEDHRRTPGSFDGADHDVRLRDGSLAARAAGETLPRRRSPTTTRASTASARGWRSRAGPRSTSSPRRSRTRSAATRSASSGTRRRTRRAASSARSWPKRRHVAPFEVPHRHRWRWDRRPERRGDRVEVGPRDDGVAAPQAVAAARAPRVAPHVGERRRAVRRARGRSAGATSSRT